MNIAELQSFMLQTGAIKSGLCAKKNKDYSRGDEVHANFKEVAAICRILGVDVSKPEGCVEFMIAWKMHRLFRLINAGQTPANETLLDSGVDMEVYTELLLTLVREGNNG